MTNNSTIISCYHCGLDCNTDEISIGDKVFCCHGCQTTYEILETGDLCNYYDLNPAPGSTPNEAGLETKFSFLDDETLQNQLLNYADGDRANITLSIPSMHCSSCIWLLEGLYKLSPGIANSKVNFLKKTVNITYNTKTTDLKSVVRLLASLGYEPEFNLQQISDKSQQSAQKSLYIKIGLAGFAFANIMLLSLPEYFAKVDDVPESFIRLFGWLNILLALPVLLYSARDYFISAWKGIRHRAVNMDIPIALGILTLFIRSLFEIVSGIGQGWMDSFAGLVFFLLIGRLFQDKTYQRLSFERDYRSYFPLSVIRQEGSKENSIPLEKLNPGDRILVRNNEIIPADSILI
ncbi:MAG: heavy metal translocating P-type ATPase, partial [Simkaniaceae bacterium]|nr:heavy metal translocating P-type ATPase [Simkaniaceae bacterium]